MLTTAIALSGVSLVACPAASTTESSDTESSDTGSSDTGSSDTGSSDTGGTGPEQDTRLFDETGVWTLEKYTLDGLPFQDIDQSRRNRFLLRFKPEDGVVAAAACHEMGTGVDIDSSTCINAGLSTWSCDCFSYTYENDTMVWQQFDPGTTPPAVGMGNGAHSIILAAFEDIVATYQWFPLPAGLFNSDGSVAKHVFELKPNSVWTEVDINSDGTPDLEACSMSCFPSEGNGG